MTEHRALPFQPGTPSALSPGQWTLTLAALAFGFLLFTAPIPAFQGAARQFIPVFFFLALPLAALGRHRIALFHRITARDFALILAFTLATLLITHLTAGHRSGPPPTALRLAFFLLLNIPQLFGEELLAILPFLALLSLLGRHLPRRAALCVAWPLSCVIFAAAHLPLNGWDWTHCLTVITPMRLSLTLAYVLGRNIWVSTGAHALHNLMVLLAV